MARVLFPKLLPGYCISQVETHSPDFTNYQTIVTLTQLLEVYWRVRRWRVSITSPFSISYEADNWLNASPPQDNEENKLVCGYVADIGDGLQSYIGCEFSYFEERNFPESFQVSGGFFNAGLISLNPAIYSRSENRYYMAIYLEAVAITSITPLIQFEAFSTSNFGPMPGLAKFNIPLVLSNSTVNIPAFYSTEFAPLSTFKIEAIEWWPYRDESGVPFYNTQTGLRV
jgi:hypothetical protein